MFLVRKGAALYVRPLAVQNDLVLSLRQLTLDEH